MEYRDIDIEKTWIMQKTLNFTRYFFRKRFGRRFVVGQHHEIIGEALDRVLRGECKRLMINIAPRYGKTEQAIKNFIAAGFALNPKAKFIHLSYSDDLARDNSRDVQEIMRTPEYQRLFGQETQPVTVSTRKWTTRAGGGLYAISSAGQVTGFGAGLVDKEDEAELMREIDEVGSLKGASLPPIEDGDDLNDRGGVPVAEPEQQEETTFGGAIVIDDPIKPDDARSDQIREKVNQKFETTIRNRVNSRNTPIIIIMQRLDLNDLCGYLQKLEPDEWEVVKLPCIYNDPETGEERALWPFKHTLEELHSLREKNRFVFETQYMQNPQPLEGLMYDRPFKTYQTIPAYRTNKRKNYTDTADTGADFHCSIDYVETEIGNYILDVLFTQKPMEYTEQRQAEMMSRDLIETSNIESNNGGRGFARNVERICREIGNNTTHVAWFHQAENKQARIFTHSNEVMNLTYFPEGWEKMWPDFHRALVQYMKTGQNAHDDAPDALTGTVEKRRKKQAGGAAGYFG